MSHTRGEVKWGLTTIFQASWGRPRSGRIEPAAVATAATETTTASRDRVLNRSVPISSDPATTISPPADAPTRNMKLMMYMPQVIVLERPVTPSPLRHW